MAKRTKKKQTAEISSTAFTQILANLHDIEKNVDFFWSNFIALQSYLLKSEHAAVLQISKATVEIVASSPPYIPDSPRPLWIEQVCETAAKIDSIDEMIIQPVISPDDLYGTTPKNSYLFFPLHKEQDKVIFTVLIIDSPDQTDINKIKELLELSVSFFKFHHTKLALQQKELDLERVIHSIDLVSAINQHQEFQPVAMELCNYLTAAFKCDRVAFGVLNGRYVKVKAMNHSEKFTRNMKLVSSIELAMEECLDQNCEVFYPIPADNHTVSKAAKHLSENFGRTSVYSFPMRKDGETIAVVTLERPGDQLFIPEEVISIRLALEVTTPYVLKLHTDNKWFGDKSINTANKAVGKLFGPGHAWTKLAGIAIFVLIFFLTFVKGTYRADAPFVFKSRTHRVIPSPFDGYIRKVNIEPGDHVKPEVSELAELDTAELKLQLAAAKAEKIASLKKSAACLRDRKTAQAQIAKAKANKASADIKLYEHYIKHAKLRSPIEGYIVAGDLKKQVGGPVKKGDVLFEVAGLKDLYAELFVPEDEIADMKENQQGELATASFPGIKIGFVVEKINPMAEVHKQKNVFRVRVKLLNKYDWMRPGMEGIAKVDIGSRSYGWIIFHKFLYWLRMKLWI